MKQIISLLLIISCTLAINAQSKRIVNPENNYGNNLVTFSPFAGIASGSVGSIGVGVGYEHFINNYVSVKVPILIGIEKPYLDAMIQLKLYPKKHQGVFKYAIVPSIHFGSGTIVNYKTYYDTATAHYINVETTGHTVQVGFILNHSLNFTINKKMYVGMEAGLGINYIDKEKYKTAVVNNNSSNITPIFQGNISLGYRF